MGASTPMEIEGGSCVTDVILGIVERDSNLPDTAILIPLTKIHLPFSWWYDAKYLHMYYGGFTCVH